MAILEKEVWVNVVSSNAKFYENLEYEIPKYIDKYKILRYKVNSKILVNVEHLQKGSDVEVTKVCDDCGVIIGNRPYGSVIKARDKGDNLDRCFNCGQFKRGSNQKDKIQYMNSLECWAKENGKEYLLDEFSIKNKKIPSKVFFGTEDYYLWTCNICQGEYEMRMNKRTSDRNNCPYCAGKRVLIGFNDLWTTHPDIANMLVNKQNGYELSLGSHKRENFMCQECGFIVKNKKVFDTVRRGFMCPRCSDGISYPEKFLLCVLYQSKINFQIQKTFKWSNRKRFDFYLEDKNTIIEIHGEQHYKYTGFTRSLDEEQENDNAKKKLAINNGIGKYIIIDARKSENEFLRNSIIESELSCLIDFSIVDWDVCNEYASNSLLKNACDMWNRGIKSTGKIGDSLMLHTSTIIRYLKQGTKLGWCDYDPKKSHKFIVYTKTSHNKKEIVQLTLNKEFIQEFESAREAARVLNFNSNSLISGVCTGRREKAYGFHWMYKKDYEKIINDKIKK